MPSAGILEEKRPLASRDCCLARSDRALRVVDAVRDCLVEERDALDGVTNPDWTLSSVSLLRSENGVERPEEYSPLLKM